MNLIEYFKKIETMKLVESDTIDDMRYFEDAWLEKQEFEFSREGIIPIPFSLKEAKFIIRQIPDYLRKLSDKYETNIFYLKNFDLIMFSIKQEYKELKHYLKFKENRLVSYHLTFLLSLIKSVEKNLKD